MVVRQQLDSLRIQYQNLQMGQVELATSPAAGTLDTFRDSLQKAGFELLDNKKAALVERIKNTIISLVQGYNDDEFNMKISALLEEKTGMEYHYLTTLFSSVERVTIEKFVILQRVEKVKELLTYDEMSLSEIARELGYSSVLYLSQQFKKVTGLTPSDFKKLKEDIRRPLDKV